MTGRRLPVVLLVSYVGFLAYGSFFPFDFTYDPDALKRIFAGAARAEGHRRISVTDVIANLLLGAPFGLLMVWSSLAGRSLAARIGSVVLLDAALASAVELGQLFTPSRTPSSVDVVAQVIGSLAGCLAGHGLLGRPHGSRGARLATALGNRPALLVLLVVAGVLTADALYPFAVTLDVSTAWHNLREGQWRPLASFTHAFWLDRVVEKGFVYVAAGALTRAAFNTGRPCLASLSAWACTTAFAVILEGAKLGVVGRAPNVDTILLAMLGGLVGVTVVPALARSPAVRARASVLLACGAIALLVYEELTPFGFVDSTAALQARFANIEWVPFASYYGADPQSALFDLGKKIVLGGVAGVALRNTRFRWRLLLAILLATVLEAAQVFQPVHTAATSDVLTISLGAILGAHLANKTSIFCASRRGP